MLIKIKLKMKLQRLLLKGVALLISIITINNLSAQVTIGVEEVPMYGALLQLKTKKNISDGSANATKGLGLPRVQLLDIDDLTGILSSGEMVGNYKETHEGLLVYSVSEGCSNGHPFYPGTYVWNGLEWEFISPEIVDALEKETATTLTDRDGNIYPIAKFGNAGTWMTQNLRTKTAPGGFALVNHIFPAQGNLARRRNFIYPGPGSGAITDGTDPTVFEANPEYGLLYNWFAATNNQNCVTVDQGQIVGTVPGSNEVENTHGYIQGICPKGWHLPSDREWNLLEKELTENAHLYSSSSASAWDPDWELTNSGRRGVHGNAMKSPTKVMNADVSNNTGGTSYASDATPNAGFNLYLTSGANQYSSQGLFSSFGRIAYFWTSSKESIGSNVWIRTFVDSKYANSSGVLRSASLADMMFSVRCKKDQ